MISFDPKDPFPFLEFGSYNYAAAKEHAVQVDRFLGLKIHEIESSLPSVKPKELAAQEMWIGLDAQSFLTPYVEIRTALEMLELKAQDRVIDLGCGYARMAHIIGRHYPDVKFIGYEIVHERVQEALRSLAPFGYRNVQVEQIDLVEHAPEAADHYFIYDYGSNQAISKTLLDLQKVARHQPIQIIARGRASRHLIHRDHPWLCEVNTPRHCDTFSIYRS